MAPHPGHRPVTPEAGEHDFLARVARYFSGHPKILTAFPLTGKGIFAKIFQCKICLMA